MRGSSDEYGSWNTICTWRRCSRALRPAPEIVSPSSVISPPVTGTSPTIALASVVLPDPDSPSRPTTLPAGTSRLTQSTAVWACRPAPYPTDTSRTDSRVMPSPPPDRASRRRRCAGASRRRASCSAISPSGGRSTRQRSSARGQRGANAHPGSVRRGSGGRPGIVVRGRWRSTLRSGTAASRRTRVGVGGAPVAHPIHTDLLDDAARRTSRRSARTARRRPRCRGR